MLSKEAPLLFIPKAPDCITLNVGEYCPNTRRSFGFENDTLNSPFKDSAFNSVFFNPKSLPKVSNTFIIASSVPNWGSKYASLKPKIFFMLGASSYCFQL